MSQPKLSIITSTFNSEKTLPLTINSILSQSYRPLEYIIVDGASSDGTVDLIKAAEENFSRQNIDFKYLSEKDSGIYNAWNKGLAMASGDWIAFLGSDDEYYPNAVSEYAKAIIDHPHLDLVYAKTKMYSNDQLLRTFGERFKWSTFKREMKILHAGSFINKEYFNEYGSFDESFKISGDYEHLLRKGDQLRVLFIDHFLVKMSADGVSSSLVKRALKESMRARVKSGARILPLAIIDYYWVRSKIALKKLFNGN